MVLGWSWDDSEVALGGSVVVLVWFWLVLVWFWGCSGGHYDKLRRLDFPDGRDSLKSSLGPGF